MKNSLLLIGVLIYNCTFGQGTIQTLSVYETKVYEMPSLSSAILTTIPNYSTIELIEVIACPTQNDKYFKVVYNGIIGWVYISDIYYNDLYHIALRKHFRGTFTTIPNDIKSNASSPKEVVSEEEELIKVRLKTIKNTQSTIQTLSVYEAKVYEMPSLNSTILTSIPNYTTVELIEVIACPTHNDKYFKIVYNGIIGWVYISDIYYNDLYHIALRKYYRGTFTTIPNDIKSNASSPKEVVSEEEKLIKERLKAIKNSLGEGNTVSENVKTDVKASVKEEVNLDGNKEINLHVEYLYEVIKATIEQKTDDFPPGGYKLTSSNAAKLTAKLLKQTIENELSKYFTNSTKVSIKITGTTDGTPIQSAIPYTGDYGNFDEEMYFLNDNIETVSISSKTGIKTNAQLAFLRTQGIRKFLETYVEPLKQTDNTFQHFAIVKSEKGSQYRKISVEIVIHDAFNLQKRDNLPAVNNNRGSELSKLFLKCKKPVFMVFASDNINTSQGSGFFVNSSGVAVSNYHVFEGTYLANAMIYTEDGKTYEVEKVLERNKAEDYIIFKVKNPYNVKFPFANISFLEPIEGEKVFAITNPEGFEKTLSDGIISAFRENKDLIQTTTPITHGSSGGPLFNMRGEVIGITTKGLQEGSLFFAINIRNLNLMPYK